MRFTIRDLTFDLAILFLAALVWFNTDRHAVYEAFQAVLSLVIGI